MKLVPELPPDSTAAEKAAFGLGRAVERAHLKAEVEALPYISVTPNLPGRGSAALLIDREDVLGIITPPPHDHDNQPHE